MGWFPTNPGGVDRYVYGVIQEFMASGNPVDLYGVNLPDAAPWEKLKLINLSSATVPLPQRLWQIYHHFQSPVLSKVSAINLHFALYSFPILAKLPTSVPITFTFHGPWAIESQQEGASKVAVALKHWIEKQVYQRCDRFIVLSRAFGQILHEQYQVPWEKIHIIPGGVDIQQFQPNLTREAARAQLNFPKNRLILFTPRRLVHRMGLGTLLQAIAQVKQQVPDIWLAIAGKGP
ncbi:MAG: glycosyltransferase family 4 protein, partial [Synechococcales bacterium]|nr:glycosyltransferase family 4 protein [Synechococcales bacterium]